MLGKSLAHFYKASILVLLAAFLYGCPHHFVEQIEKTKPYLPKDIKNYKPVYLKKSISADKLLEYYATQYPDSLGFMDSIKIAESGWNHETPQIDDSLSIPDPEWITESPDSTGSRISQLVHPIQMKIIKVDDKKYPGEVKLRALVFDTSGRYISGLAPPYLKNQNQYKDYWARLEDSCSGIKNTIDDYSVREIRQNASEPYAISFVLDHSPSMGDRKALLLQKAVKKVLGAIKKGDMVSLVKFTNKMNIEIPLTDDPKVYRNSIVCNGLKGNYGGGTSIYDGVLSGISELRKAPDKYRKVVILFSDGMDNSSKASFDSLKIAAKSDDVMIYTIAYGLADPEILENLANFSGGRYYYIFSSKEFPYVFYDIYVTLNNYYEITYKAPECEGIHTVNSHLGFPGTRLPGISTSGEYDRSVFRKYDPVGTVTFMNIEFDFGKATVKQESLPLIEKVAASMNTHQSIKIVVYGHTDNVGSDEFNLELSRKRALAVKQQLVSMGIDDSRIKTKGYGELKPLVSNDTDENRKKNRRTEFVIIEK